MTPTQILERWDPNGAAGWRRRERELVAQWVPGVVRPSAANTGPITAEAELANYAGSFTNMKPGDVITGLAITGGVTFTQSNVTLRDSLILNQRRAGYAPSVAGETPTVMLAVNALQAGVTGCVVEDVAIRVPEADRTFDTYGIQGRNITVRRTEIAGVVDGIVAHGTTAVRGYVDVEGCFIHDLEHYASDPRQVDGSHNDGIQAQGALSRLRIVGNTILGGYTSAILITQDVAHPDGYDEVTVTDNWLDMEHPDGGSVVNVADKGVGPVEGYTLARNKFGRSSPTRPRILTSDLTKAAATTYMPTSGANANVFWDNGQVVPYGFVPVPDPDAPPAPPPAGTYPAAYPATY